MPSPHQQILVVGVVSFLCFCAVGIKKTPAISDRSFAVWVNTNVTLLFPYASLFGYVFLLASMYSIMCFIRIEMKLDDDEGAEDPGYVRIRLLPDLNSHFITLLYSGSVTYLLLYDAFLLVIGCSGKKNPLTVSDEG